jgi:hypothetical protein
MDETTARDFPLGGESVSRIPAITRRPESASVRCVVDLHADSKLVAVLADATFQDDLDIQPLPDFADVDAPALELECRSLGKNAQARNAPKGIDQFVGQPIAEGIVVHGAQVAKWQHSNRRAFQRGGCCFVAGIPQHQAHNRGQHEGFSGYHKHPPGPGRNRSW